MHGTCENLTKTRALIEDTIQWADKQQRLPVIYLQEDRTPFRAGRSPVLEIAYHAAGSETLIELGPYQYRSRPGTVLIMTTPVGYRATPRGAVSVWNLSLNISADAPVEGLADAPLIVAARAPVSTRVVERYRVAAYGHCQQRIFQHIQLRCEVLGILVALLEALTPPGDQQSERGPATMAAIRLINRKYHRPGLRRADLARVAHLSEAQFARVFRREMGLTPMDYLRRVRVDRARVLLARTELNVEEVGRAVGLPELSHFSRLFRALQGRSPRAFRRQLK